MEESWGEGEGADTVYLNILALKQYNDWPCVCFCMSLTCQFAGPYFRVQV